MNYKELVAKLRTTVSESKRAMLDEAADTIEGLAADLARLDCCELCVHCQNPAPCEDADFDCDCCPHDCACKTCKAGDKWEWRGIQREG